MITNTPRWALKLTHAPTGISVEVDSSHFKTQQQAKAAGLKLLKAKVNFWMAEPYNSGDILVASYILPDDTYWPEDLHKYKKE